MDLEGPAGEFAHGFDEVGKKQQGLDVVAVGDVEVKALGVGLDALDLGGQVGEVGRPERGGTFQHG